MLDGGPWRRAKSPPYRLTCGAAISEYGAVIIYKIGHGGKPKKPYPYPPWQIFDKTGIEFHY